MSGTPGGQGGYQQNQQNFSYDDGNQSFQYHSEQSSWTSYSQQSTPAPVQPQPQLIQQAPSMQQHTLPGFDIHQQHMQLHNQHVAQAMQDHAAVTQNMQQMQNNIMQNFLPPALPAPLLPYQQQPQQQQQVGYAPSPVQIQYQQAPQIAVSPVYHQPAQIAAPPQGHVSEGESESDGDSQSESENESSGEDEREEKRGRELEQMEKRLAARSAAAEQAARDEAQKLRNELRQLKDLQESQDRKDREASNRKAEALEQQLARVMQEKATDQQRHSRDLAQLHERMSQQQTPPLDLSALHHAIEQLQSGTLSKADITNLVKDTVGKTTAGLATTKDMESAATAMQKEFKRLPSALSGSQIDDAVQRGFDRAIDKHVQPQPKQQRLEAPRVPGAQPRQQQRPSQRETTFEVTDLSEDANVPVYTPKALEAPGQSGAAQDGHGLPAPGYVPSSYSKSRVSVQPSYDNAVSRVKRTEAPRTGSQQQVDTPLSAAALARLPALSDGASQHRSSKSRASVRPSDDNAVSRVKHSAAPSSVSNHTGVKSSEITLARLPGPGNDSYQSSSSKSTASAQPSGDNALSRVSHSTAPTSISRQQSASAPLTQSALARLPAPGSSSSKSTHSKSRASVLPSDHNALTRSKRSVAPSSIHVTQPVGTGAALVGSDAKTMLNPKKPTVHSSGSHAPSQFSSSAQAMAAPYFPGAQPGNYGGHAGLSQNLGLPEDFPDNASQITSWERSREPKRSVAGQGMVDSNTVARMPKNDRRSEVAAPPPSSGLRQVTYAPSELDAGGQALVRQSKDVAKRSSRQ
ncbi:hypothetical protein LTR08_007265 [Meristemomyces frigidus]|nr:hypothetical protein LTR08_007265 [Meristemomyces frigidus]